MDLQRLRRHLRYLRSVSEYKPVSGEYWIARDDGTMDDYTLRVFVSEPQRMGHIWTGAYDAQATEYFHRHKIVGIDKKEIRWENEPIRFEVKCRGMRAFAKTIY